jgi:hypothetical protein
MGTTISTINIVLESLEELLLDTTASPFSIASRLSKETLPRPVTGSYPEEAEKPAPQQTASDASDDTPQLLDPDVMSLNSP